MNHRADLHKAQCPGGAGQSAEETRTENPISVPRWLTLSKPRYPGLHGSREEWAAFNRLPFPLREQLESEWGRTKDANRQAVEFYSKRALTFEQCGRFLNQGVWGSPGVNRFEHSLHVMPYELAVIQGLPHKAGWFTTVGTFAGFTTTPKTLHRRLLLDVEHVDRRYLIDGRYLMLPPEVGKGVLDPRDLLAREEYAARFCLAMLPLGGPLISDTKNARAAYERLRTEIEQGGAA